MSGRKPGTPEPVGWPSNPPEIVTGKPAERAPHLVEERAQFVVAENRQVAVGELFDEWVENAAADPRGHVIFTNTASEAVIANKNSQFLRAVYGHVPNRGMVVGDAADPDHHLVIAAGDRILLARTRPELGVEAGDLGTVLGIDRGDQSLRVKLDRDGKEVTVPTDVPEDIRLGYAMTHREGWGRDVEHAYILGDHRLSGANFVGPDPRIRVFIDWSSASREVGAWLGDLARSEFERSGGVTAPAVEAPPTIVTEVER